MREWPYFSLQPVMAAVQTVGQRECTMGYVGGNHRRGAACLGPGGRTGSTAQQIQNEALGSFSNSIKGNHRHGAGAFIGTAGERQVRSQHSKSPPSYGNLQTFLNPMLMEFSLKHLRHNIMWYLRIRPWLLPHLRLQAKGIRRSSALGHTKYFIMWAAAVIQQARNRTHHTCQKAPWPMFLLWVLNKSGILTD